jgi:hypothetical protein
VNRMHFSQETGAAVSCVHVNEPSGAIRRGNDRAVSPASHLESETDTVSETLCALNIGRWTKSKISSMILMAIHHRQGASESDRKLLTKLSAPYRQLFDFNLLVKVTRIGRSWCVLVTT